MHKVQQAASKLVMHVGNSNNTLDAGLSCLGYVHCDTRQCIAWPSWLMRQVHTSSLPCVYMR